MASASSRTCSVFLGFDDEEFSETMKGLAWSHDGPEFSPRIELMSFEIDLSARLAADVWRRVVLVCGQLAAAVNPLRLRCGKISGHATDGQRALTVEIQGRECAAVRELVIALFAQAKLAQAADDASFEPHACIFCARARNGAVAPPPWSERADWVERELGGAAKFEGRVVHATRLELWETSDDDVPAWTQLRAWRLATPPGAVLLARVLGMSEPLPAALVQRAGGGGEQDRASLEREREVELEMDAIAREMQLNHADTDELRRLAARATHCIDEADPPPRAGGDAPPPGKAAQRMLAEMEAMKQTLEAKEQIVQAKLAMANKLAARNHQVSEMASIVSSLPFAGPAPAAKPSAAEMLSELNRMAAQLGDGAARE